MSAAFRFTGTLESPETALLWELGCTGAVQEGREVVAYFRSVPDHLDDFPVGGRWEMADDKDWVADYYTSLISVAVGRLVIAPTHRQVTLSAGQRALWLDPGMAFGSGHHETTLLALEALEQSDLRGKRVLDVGSGSGILAIAADLLGAAQAFGIDIDPQTVPVAKANAALNLSRARFAVGTSSEVVEPADMIVANLYAELHAELAPEYERTLKPGGELFATGILAARGEVARSGLARHLELVEVRQKGKWLLVHARKPRESVGRRDA